jgi:hypothetical protein
MKLKLLLLFIGIANLIWAQEPYTNLVITEARTIQGDFNNGYLEITNMGDKPIDLKEIKIAKGMVKDFVADGSGWFYLPESVSKVLQPGESYVMTIGLDFSYNLFKARIPGHGYGDRAKNHDIYQYADFIAHREEKNDLDRVLYPHVKDSAIYSPDSSFTFTHYVFPMGHLSNLLNKGVWLEHHFPNGDSAVIDQVKNMFDSGNGNNSNTAWDVAGVTNATAKSILVRKSSVKTGNLDFANSRGVGLEDSEWLPLVPPENQDDWRDIWWTVGNHGNFVLDENTLEPKSEGFNVNFAGKIITVPWGTRRLDGIMQNMKYKPGVAWIYHLNESLEDSLYRSAKTGDKLTIYVVGETLYEANFDIVVADATPSANTVVPIDHINLEGGQGQGNSGKGRITNNAQKGKLNWPRVTAHANGMDTITGGGYGLPYALRTDSLLKYLEKPANARWEFVWVDGERRADLKTGDKLKVIAQNGDTKEYFLELQGYAPSNNANLASITWPDISLDEFYKVIYNWKGDTVPNFNPSSTSYRLVLPYDFEGMLPALVSRTQNLNASVEVKRATTLEGSLEDRTTSFEVTAEDDSVKRVYNVELAKEKDPVNLQPYLAQPFVSEFGRAINGSGYLEIANPGNQPLDLSDYMFAVSTNTNPVNAITGTMSVNDWNNRFNKYVPGYKWVSKVDWPITPGILVKELNVNSIIQPGEVFLMGQIANDSHVTKANGYNSDGDWSIPSKLNVQFSNTIGKYHTYSNTWGDSLNSGSTPIPNTFTEHGYMFKILNDSVKQGLKPANDPNDFELIEALAYLQGRWYVAGFQQTQNWIMRRKPEITKPNPLIGNSFGTNQEDSEWIVWNQFVVSSVLNLPGGYQFHLESDLGQHFFYEPTEYMSTITALVYKVSKGYTLNESIRGIVTGTSVEQFIGNIFKADEGQTLTVKSFADGSELAMKALLSNSDTLVVLSADSVNTTKYVLEVNDKGLSSNAILTSGRYKVTIEQDPKSASKETAEAGVGNIKGFDYGTALRTILANVKVPPGASLAVIDGQGAYVPLKMLNFDTTYVNVTVNDNIYLDVVAENGVTRIIYQLVPEVSDNDAFLTSDVYTVVQKDVLIHYVPRGTSVQAFLANLVPSAGATMKLVDKLGNERTVGSIVQDDKVVVTSPNGLNSRVYFLSMLATQNIKVTTYLAYILSPFYGIDQVAYKVAGVSGAETVSAFLAKVIAAPGATAYVVDKNGAVKTTGDINGSDMVKVVSADGVMNVFYTFGPLTSAGVLEANDIQLYPNPTNGKINVSGVKAGNRIQVYNSLGAMIRDIKVQSTIETISFDNQPAGMYMIVISDQNKMLGRYKALRK